MSSRRRKGPKRKTTARRAYAARASAAVVSGQSPKAKKARLYLVSSDARLSGLVKELGNNRVADILEVSPSQPSRWKSGTEGISVANERRVLDLDYVMARLLRLFPKEQAEIWLESHNAHLGARPIDALKMRGVSSVIEAIDAEEQGAYA